MTKARQLLVSLSEAIKTPRDKWIDFQLKRLRVSAGDEEDVVLALNSIWNDSNTIVLKPKAKKYDRQLRQLSDASVVI